MFLASIEENPLEIGSIEHEDFVFPEFEFTAEPLSDRVVEDEPDLLSVEGSEAEEVPGSDSPRVLIVEDNLINQMITSELVGNAGCSFEVAENGQLAVDLIRKQPFDIILMDCQMPVMNGFEATEEIRRLQAAGELPHLPPGEIPILAVTANAFESDRNDCLNAGMNAHLTKPIDRDILLGAMGEYLGMAIDAEVTA